MPDNILAIVSDDNQRGCPYLDCRLHLLNAVESSPQEIASPEHDWPFCSAMQFMVSHNARLYL